MLEELKRTDIVKKMGGRFKLTALVQKRMTELMQGARPLIEDSKGRTSLEIVIQEILQNKIDADYLSGDVKGPSRTSKVQ